MSAKEDVTIKAQDDGRIITNRDSVRNNQSSQPAACNNDNKGTPEAPQPATRSFNIIIYKGLTPSEIHETITRMTDAIRTYLGASDPEALAEFESQPQEEFMRASDLLDIEMSTLVTVGLPVRFERGCARKILEIEGVQHIEPSPTEPFRLCWSREDGGGVEKAARGITLA